MPAGAVAGRTHVARGFLFMRVVAMGRKQAVDDDDDDLPPRLGRPPAPERYGPPRLDAHERPEYVRRLQAILDAVEITDLGRDERLYLQKIIRRYDMLHCFDKSRFPNQGSEQVTHLLRLVFESSNGVTALKLPILRAVSDCMYPVWIEKGLAFVEALDHVDLVALHDTLRELVLEDQLARALRRKLEAILGPPISSQPETKTPARKMVKPPTVSQEAWDDVIQIQKLGRKKTAERRTTHKKSPAARAA
jgi:hypothetical protein